MTTPDSNRAWSPRLLESVRFHDEGVKLMRAYGWNRSVFALLVLGFTVAIIVNLEVGTRSWFVALAGLLLQLVLFALDVRRSTGPRR